MTIAQDVQKLSVSPIIELYQLDLTTIPGLTDVYYWTPQVNKLGAQVVWKGQAYTPWPISLSGLGKTGKGQIPRPTLILGNISRLITAIALVNDDIVGAKFTRRRTLEKYLDAVNFPGGVNPTADSNAEFPMEIYYVDRKSKETREFVEFELASPMDVHGVKLPGRQVVQNYCPFIYKDATSGCDYTPAGSYWDANDLPTTAGNDVCGHRLASCKLRNGSNANGLPFGGFPAAGLLSS